MTGFKLEPVGWMYSYIGGTEVQTSMERWIGEDWKSYWEETPLYTAPQPTPDVARLVEALEAIERMDFDDHSLANATLVARNALAAHRKGGVQP